ncbi:MAG TPA: methyl-accepting chemotaxis protein [Burkholderiaceae bacterium]
MNRFRKLTVAQRLSALIAIAAIGLCTLAGMGLFQIGHVYTAAGYANENTVPSLITIDEAYESFLNLRLLAYQHVVGSDAKVKSDKEGKMLDEKNKLDAALQKYEALLSDDKDKALLAGDRDAVAAYEAQRKNLVALSNEGKAVEADALLVGGLREAAQQVSNAIMAHRNYNIELGRQGASDALAIEKNARTMLAGAGLATLLLIVALGAMLVRSLLRQLGGEPSYAAGIAEEIAKGNLSVAVEARSKAHPSLLGSIKTMRDSLQDIVQQVRSGTDTIATASREIADGSMDLSTRTEQQAGSLEETASSMEELTATVKHNSDLARAASKLADAASSKAFDGGTVVAHVVETMSGINESAKQMADIIGVIDGIAFQTNILALNAAVEAARAGEQGRGFAVVAAEVRTLAQRSAGAAKEIKALIDDSVGKIAAGNALVGQAGTTMEDVVASVKQVAQIVGEIADSSTEQEAGINQINRAVTDMDTVTQQNAALVEEASAAAAALEQQAAALAKLVALFQLDARDAAARASDTPMKPPTHTPPDRRRRELPISRRLTLINA